MGNSRALTVVTLPPEAGALRTDTCIDPSQQTGTRGLLRDGAEESNSNPGWLPPHTGQGREDPVTTRCCSGPLTTSSDM